MRRRLLDMLAVLLLLFFLISCVGLIRSRAVWEQWAMPPRPTPPLAGAKYQWVTQRFVESARGRISIIETTVPVVGPLPTWGASSPVRYYHRSYGDLYVNYALLPFTPQNKTRVVLPGITLSSVPVQLGPPQAAPAPSGVPPPPLVLSGLRSMSISWWLLAVLTAMFPSWWGRRRWLHYRRAWRVRHDNCPACGYDVRATHDRCPECGTARDHFCPACGYDVRATPDRCPECGTVPTAATTNAA